MQENFIVNDLECDFCCYFLLLVKEDCGILNQESWILVLFVSDIYYFLFVVVDVVLYLKEVFYFQKIVLVSNEEIWRKNFFSGMVYIFLDGCIMNVVFVIFFVIIGGNLGEEEV